MFLFLRFNGFGGVCWVGFFLKEKKKMMEMKDYGKEKKRKRGDRKKEMIGKSGERERGEEGDGVGGCF